MCARRRLKSDCADVCIRAVWLEPSLSVRMRKLCTFRLSQMCQVKIVVRLRECAGWFESSLDAYLSKGTISHVADNIFSISILVHHLPRAVCWWWSFFLKRCNHISHCNWDFISLKKAIVWEPNRYRVVCAWPGLQISWLRCYTSHVKQFIWHDACAQQMPTLQNQVWMSKLEVPKKDHNHCLSRAS